MYKLLIGNIHNDNVKDKTGDIRRACGIKSSISADVFKLRLAECIQPGMTIYDEFHDCIFGEERR